MDNRGNDRRSLVMLVSSMLIFGTIGVFRRSAVCASCSSSG